MPLANGKRRSGRGRAAANARGQALSADRDDPEQEAADPTRDRPAGLARLLRYRLMIPIARGRADKRPAARGVAIGLGLAMMPTIGIQMALVFGIWAALRILVPQWRFNMVIALAWTWITNVFTMGPIYYAFLVTGNLILLRDDPFGGFDAFTARLDSLLASDAGPLESFWIYTVQVFTEWGLPLFVGCVPWAILSAWLGYVWCLKFLDRLQERQRKRRARKSRARGRIAEADNGAA